MSATTLVPGTRCPRHAMILATQVCDGCGRGGCDRCVLPQADGTIRCLCCTAPAAEPLPPPTPASVAPVPGALPARPLSFAPAAPYAHFKCGSHPENEAVARCSGCGAHVCGVCDFRVTGGRHACPACVMKEPDGITGKRRTLAIVGCLLAAWSTLGLGMLVSGYFASMVQTPGDQSTLEMAIVFLVFVPTLLGFTFSTSSLERNQPNSTFLWVTVVWNALLLAGYLALTVVGTFS